MKVLLPGKMWYLNKLVAPRSEAEHVKEGPMAIAIPALSLVAKKECEGC
jgi:hypothetical protein